MQTIIGSPKEFIVIERKELEKMQQGAQGQLERWKGMPKSEGAIEARMCLEMVEWIKENNIYNKEFKIKG